MLEYRQPPRLPKRKLPSYIYDAGQVLNIPFHLGSKDVAHDLTDYRNHGLLLAPTWEPVPTGWGVRFRAGINDYISILDSPSVRIAIPFTLEALIYRTLSDWESLISKSDPVASNRGYSMRISDAVSGNVLQLLFGDGGTIRYWSAGVVPLNSWTYLAAIYDGANIIIHVNTTEWSNAIGAFPIAHDASPLYLGRQMTGDNIWYKGLMAMARLYSGRALTFADRLRHYYSWLGA